MSVFDTMAADGGYRGEEARQVAAMLEHRASEITTYEADPACRVCGCTNENACARPATIFDDTREAQMAPDGQLHIGCAWAEPDLCTACIDDAVPGWIHPNREDLSP
jgi:hypothetical protein